MLPELKYRTAKKVPFLEIQAISCKRRGHSNALIYNPIFFGALICGGMAIGINQFFTSSRRKLRHIAAIKQLLIQI
jgi:hypothetical protein